MYQELQELVLSNVHVRVRPEGQVHPFYDKVTLRLAPTLKQNERYRYLVERLVPKPRNLQENAQATANDGADSPKREESTVNNENATVAKTQVSTSTKEVEQREVQPAIPMQADKQESKEMPQLVQESDSLMKDASANDVIATSNDVAMCSTLPMLFPEQRDGPTWVPPKVTHEFSYPSDEEIVPNPKAYFSKKGLLPKLGKVCQ